MAKQYTKYKDKINFTLTDVHGENCHYFNTKKEMAKWLGLSLQKVHENVSKGYGFNYKGKRLKLIIHQRDGKK